MKHRLAPVENFVYASPKDTIYTKSAALLNAVDWSSNDFFNLRTNIAASELPLEQLYPTRGSQFLGVRSSFLFKLVRCRRIC